MADDFPSFLMFVLFVSFVVRSSAGSEHKPLNGCFWVGPEVGQESDFVSRRFEVVQNLCPVFGGDFFDGFDFEDHLVEAQKIGAEGLGERLTAIGEAVVGGEGLSERGNRFHGKEQACRVLPEWQKAVL